MLNKPKKVKKKPTKDFYFSIWGYTRKQFQNWGKQGGQGQPIKYISNAEKQIAYRRRKARIKLLTTKGILSMKTGRISKYRTKAEKQKAYRERKKLKGVN